MLDIGKLYFRIKGNLCNIVSRKTARFACTVKSDKLLQQKKYKKKSIDYVDVLVLITGTTSVKNASATQTKLHNFCLLLSFGLVNKPSLF